VIDVELIRSGDVVTLHWGKSTLIGDVVITNENLFVTIADQQVIEFARRNRNGRTVLARGVKVLGHQAQLWA
jgi:CobQ-like glutamine amidotransferase family enzyme